MNLWVESILNHFFRSNADLKAAKAMQKQAENDAVYWQNRAVFWRKEATKIYDILQDERKENAKNRNSTL
jgi:hypothetical protein